jgi:hypothetical protein
MVRKTSVSRLVPGAYDRVGFEEIDKKGLVLGADMLMGDERCSDGSENE